MTQDEKPFHAMPLAEYTLTPHSQAVPKWSILAIPPEEYSVSVLCRFRSNDVRALAYVWGVNQSGDKKAIAERIMRRRRLRTELSRETPESLSRKSRAVLGGIAREAGVYHSWLSRKRLAQLLMQWHQAERTHARTEIARVRHEHLIVKAAKSGLFVPAENLERYGLDAQGNREPVVCGVPLSIAVRVAPDAMASARALSQNEFLLWIREHPSAAATLTLIGTGVLADGGVGFWRAVQKAFAPAAVPPLFAITELPQCRDVSGSDYLDP